MRPSWGRRWTMTHPQLLRLQDHLGQLQLFTVQERLESVRREASAQGVSDADFLDRLLTEEVTAKGKSLWRCAPPWPVSPIARPWRLRRWLSTVRRSPEAPGTGHGSVHSRPISHGKPQGIIAHVPLYGLALRLERAAEIRGQHPHGVTGLRPPRLEAHAV